MFLHGLVHHLADIYQASTPFWVVLFAVTLPGLGVGHDLLQNGGTSMEAHILL